MESNFRSHRFGFFEILDHSWSILRQGIVNFLILVLILLIPNIILVSWINPTLVYGDPDKALQSLGLLCFWYILYIGLSVLFFITVAYLVEGIVQDRAISLADAFRHAFSRLVIFFFVEVLLVMAITAGTMLLIIPGIIVAVYLLFTTSIVALRDQGLQAFQYSIDLVKGQWWRMFGLSLGVMIPIYLTIFVVNLVINEFFPGIVIASAIGSLVTNILVVLFTIYILVLFLNEDYLRHPVSQPATELEQQEH